MRRSRLVVRAIAAAGAPAPRKSPPPRRVPAQVRRRDPGGCAAAAAEQGRATEGSSGRGTSARSAAVLPPHPCGTAAAFFTSCYLREALDLGAQLFKWQERQDATASASDEVRGVGVGLGAYAAGSIAIDGLCS